MNPKLKLALVVLGKLAVLYFMAHMVVISSVLLTTALPRILFDTEAFLHAAAILLAVAIIIGLKTKSRVPLLWAIFSLGFSSLYILDAGFHGYLDYFVAGLLLAAGINYLYRNRITEPLLILLPLLSSSWLFLQLIYCPYVPIWIARKTGVMSLSEGFSLGFGTHALWISLLIAPLLVLYMLGKHYYIDIYSFLRNRYRRLRSEPPQSPSAKPPAAPQTLV
jgi:hypothetical protein